MTWHFLRLKCLPAACASCAVSLEVHLKSSGLGTSSAVSGVQTRRRSFSPHVNSFLHGAPWPDNRQIMASNGTGPFAIFMLMGLPAERRSGPNGRMAPPCEPLAPEVLRESLPFSHWSWQASLVLACKTLLSVVHPRSVCCACAGQHECDVATAAA